MTNFEWIKNMDAEQMAKDILNPCDHYECEECRIKRACKAHEDTMEWLREEHEEAEG